MARSASSPRSITCSVSGVTARRIPCATKDRRRPACPTPANQLPRQFPDFSFVQSGFEQRSQNMVLVRGLLPRPKIAHVVGG